MNKTPSGQIARPPKRPVRYLSARSQLLGHKEPYWSELASLENGALACCPINRMVPITRVRIVASIAAHDQSLHTSRGRRLSA